MVWENEDMLESYDKVIPAKSNIEIPLMSSSDSDLESESEILNLPNSDGEDFCGTFVLHNESNIVLNWT